MAIRTLVNVPGVTYDASKTDVFYAEDYNELAGDVAGLGSPPVKATGSELNTGTDDAKFATAKALADSDYAKTSDIPSVPVKATGAEVDTGTDDAKFVTAKAMEDSAYAKTTDIPVKATGAEVDTGTDDAKFVTAKAVLDSKLIASDETVTLTNKRITPRIATTTDDATAVIDVDVTDQYQLTAVANATTFSTTGTPVAGQKLIIRFKDAGVAKALTWDAVFVAIGVTLPTTTVVSKTHYVGCVYNATDSKWNVLAVGVQA